MAATLIYNVKILNVIDIDRMDFKHSFVLPTTCIV